MQNTFLDFFAWISGFFAFAKQQRRTTILVFLLSLLFLVSIFSLGFIYSEYVDVSTSYSQKNKNYLKLQESRLNTLSSIQKEDESLVSFFKKKQFEKHFKNAQAQKTIEKIKRQLRLESCKTTTGNDAVLDKEYNIYIKKISFDIQSNTDQKFYQFVDRLHHQMPGLILFKKFSVQKNPSQKMGNYLFQGTIECLWIRQKHD